MAEGTQRWRSENISLPAPANEATARLHWERWWEAAKNNDDASLRTFVTNVQDDPVAGALLHAVFGNSPYLSHCLIADQSFARLLIEDGPEAALAAALEAIRAESVGEPEPTEVLMKRLRLAKRRSALAIGTADITDAWPLKKVTAALSDIAEAALRTACRHLLSTLHRADKLALPCQEAPERGSGLIVLGMGKLGARELNYSSDIDLIVLYDQDAAVQANGGESWSIFTRLTRDLIKIIGQQTEDGYVFRTDLRLRPDPRSTPVAISVQAAENYYQNAGRNWERAAMIKARTVAGDIERGEAFLASLEPFVWRRFLDFAAGQDIQAIKQQIDASRRVDRTTVAGRDVKLGRGGIREIEFFAQAQQLIWGGRTPELRVLGTLNALDALVAAGHVTRHAATELRSAYKFLRRLEHRLQMVNDQQTHSLPENDEGLAGIAAFMSFDSVNAFSNELLDHLHAVEGWFDALFEDKIGAEPTEKLIFSGEEDDPETLEALGRMGFCEPKRVSAIVRVWLGDRYPALRSEQARQLLGRLTPIMLKSFADTPYPDTVLLRFDGFLARLPEGVRLFSLLTAHPDLFVLIAKIMGAAPRLAAQLTRHPSLLDSVLSRACVLRAMPVRSPVPGRLS